MNHLLILLGFLTLHIGVIFSQNEEEFNVKIQITQYYPYCGGASPSLEQLNQHAIYNEDLVLINLDNSEKQTIESNGKGYYLLNLKPGNYALKEMYKNVPYHEFLYNVGTTSGTYIIKGTTDCYRNWWESNLTEFTVGSSEVLTIVNTSTSSSCYTGLNPCDIYNGPIPN